MKRIILTAVALSMLVVPAAQAQSRYDGQNQPRVERGDAPSASSRSVRRDDHRYSDRRDDRRYDRHDRYDRYERDRRGDRHAHRRDRDDYRYYQNRKHRWERGQRYSDWRRHQPVQDWKRHGLHRPGHGQQWVRVGNEYLLVGIMTGVIAGILAAR